MKITRWILASTLLLTPALAFAQGPGGPGGGPGGPGGHGGKHMGPGGPEGHLLPPGTWWRDADTVAAIGLAPDQAKRIDGIFLESRVQLIRQHAALQEQELRLESAMGATPFDQARAQGEINKVADLRAELEKSNAKMLLSIRGVLTGDQWTKLQAQRGPGRGDRKMRGGPDGQGGPGGQGQRGRRGRGNGPDGQPGPGAPPPPPQNE